MVRRYFSNRRFALAWCWLKSSYFLDNPYRCSRRYAAGQACSDEFLYGETPLTVLEQITTAADVTSEDHIFELGSGSGYTSLWLRCIIGCRVSAIEQVPVFCWRLGRTQERFDLGIDVRCENFLNTDFSNATVIYLYGSALSEETIIKLALKLSTLTVGTKVISVSYALAEFIDDQSFKVIDQLTVCFDWGEAEVFVQEVIK